MQAHRDCCSFALIACLGLLSLVSCADTSAPAPLPKVLFDDPLPQGAIARLGTTRLRCDQLINSLAVAPNTEFIVTASADVIQIWDSKTGKEQSKFQFDDRWMALSPDGATLATTGKYDDLGIRLWDIESKALIREINLGDIKTRTGYTGRSGQRLHNVAFSPNGKLLAVASFVEKQQGMPMYASYRALHLIDLKTGEEIRHFSFDDNPSLWPVRFRFSPDGHSIAVIGGKDSRVCILTTDDMQIMQKFGNGAWDVTFSEDGQYLGVANYKQTQVFDCKEWKQRQSIPATEYAKHGGGTVALTPDGKLVARVGDASDAFARLWETKSGAIIRKLLNYYRADAAALEFVNNGQNLVCGSDKLIRIWDIPQGTESVLGNTFRGKLHSLAYSPDGNYLAFCGEDPGIRIHDASTRKLLYWVGRDEFVRRVAFSPDSQLLASVGHSLRLWKTITGDKIWSRDPDKGHSKYFSKSPTSVTFLPSGRRLMTGGYDGLLRLWDTTTGAHLKKYELTQPLPPNGRPLILDLMMLPEMKLIANYGGRFCLWDLKTEKIVSAFSGSSYTNDIGTPLAATANGSVIAYEGSLQRKNQATQQGVVLRNLQSQDVAQLLRKAPPHSHENLSVAFSPTQPLLAIGGSRDVVSLWNVDTHQEVAKLEGHTDFISALAFSPDGKELASASWDGTVLFWDMRDFAAPIEGEPTSSTGQ